MATQPRISFPGLGEEWPLIRPLIPGHPSFGSEEGENNERGSPVSSQVEGRDGVHILPNCPSLGHSTRKQRSLDSAVLNVIAMYTQAATSLPYIAYSLQAFILKYQLSLYHSPYCRPPVRRSLSPVSRLPLP